MEKKHPRREVRTLKRLIIYCKGPTEKSFVKTVLAPYLWGVGVFVEPIGAGGVSRYGRIKKELTRLCKNDPSAVFSTMLDYYGLPSDTPGIATASGSAHERASHIESAVTEDLGGLDNLVFNVIVHEFEGLLFSEVSAFAGIADAKQIARLQSIRADFESPEHINNAFDSTPSRRIMGIITNYAKVRDGTIIADRIGMDTMTTQCPHFGRWISRMLAMA